MNNKKQKTILITTLILLVALLVGGVFINSFANNNQTTSESVSNASTTSSASTSQATSSVSTTKPNPNLLTEQKDIAYASISESEKFDIYLPNTNGNLPVVLNIHGGAFRIGDKAGMGGFGNESGVSNSQTKILASGYAYATMNYRLSGEAIFPAAINDVKACIRYLKAHAYDLGIDPNRIFVYGQSAGGNLAALAGTSGELNFIEKDEKLGNEDQNSKVAGVVDFFGPINFLTMDSDYAELGQSGNSTSSASSPESVYMGQDITQIPELVAKSNPETYITADDPKMFVEAGSEDNNIPYLQGQKFVDKFNKVVPNGATFTLIPGAGHGTSEFEEDANLTKMINFLNSIK